MFQMCWCTNYVARKLELAAQRLPNKGAAMRRSRRNGRRARDRSIQRARRVGAFARALAQHVLRKRFRAPARTFASGSLLVISKRNVSLGSNHCNVPHAARRRPLPDEPPNFGTMPLMMLPVEMEDEIRAACGCVLSECSP